MKFDTMGFKSFFTILCASVAFACGAMAQTVSNSLQMNAFDAIEAADEFEITLSRAPEYSVSWTIDSPISELVEIYVRGRVLKIDFNRKGMSSELKKTYKGRNARKPVLKVEVYAPEISSVSLAGKAVMTVSDHEFEAGRFQVSLAGNARLSGLSVSSETFECSVVKGTALSASVNSTDIAVKTANSAAVSLKGRASRLDLQSTGSSAINLSGAYKSITLKTSGSSSVKIDGRTEDLLIDSANSSVIEASSLKTASCQVIMANSSSALVAPERLLKITMKGGKLSFSGNPRIEITDIQSASVHKL